MNIFFRFIEALRTNGKKASKKAFSLQKKKASLTFECTCVTFFSLDEYLWRMGNGRTFIHKMNKQMTILFFAMFFFLSRDWFLITFVRLVASINSHAHFAWFSINNLRMGRKNKEKNCLHPHQYCHVMKFTILSFLLFFFFNIKMIFQ